MQFLETPKPLVVISIRGIQSYYLSFSPKPLYQDTDEIKSLHEHQSANGWDNFIRGRISKNFKIYIASHYKMIKPERKPELWAKAIISNPLNIHIEFGKNYCDTIRENNNAQK